MSEKKLRCVVTVEKDDSGRTRMVKVFGGQDCAKAVRQFNSRR